MSRSSGSKASRNLGDDDRMAGRGTCEAGTGREWGVSTMSTTPGASNGPPVAGPSGTRPATGAVAPTTIDDAPGHDRDARARHARLWSSGVVPESDHRGRFRWMTGSGRS
jgi:hypothetical protein